MNTTILRVASLILFAGTLTMPASTVFAGSDYLVIQGVGDLRVGDASAAYSNPVIVPFDLPANVYGGGDTTRMAVLQLVSRNALGRFNEVYINPVVENACNPDSSDLNDGASVHYIDAHDMTTGVLRREYFTNHKVFSSTLLKPGRNVLMICARDTDGNLTGSVDDLLIRKIVLHYQTD